MCSGIIGWERFSRHKPAGLRTLVLVSIGAALVTIVSGDLVGDQIRIIAGVMTGIGFLGAGAVMAAKGHIHGLTTAASIWMVAAIGVTAGTGEYSLAIVSSVLAFIVLRLDIIKEKFSSRTHPGSPRDEHYL